MTSKTITMEWLVAKKACEAARRQFQLHFPDGGEITDVLIMITQTDDAEPDWVSWLMQKHGYCDTEWLSGLEISGSLYLSGTGITALPDGLSVGGWLDLRGCKIKKSDIPDHLTDKAIF